MALTRPTRRSIIALIACLVCGVLVAISTHLSLLWTARVEATRLSQVTATVIEPAAPERGVRPEYGRKGPRPDLDR